LEELEVRKFSTPVPTSLHVTSFVRAFNNRQTVDGSLVIKQAHYNDDRNGSQL